MEKNKSEDIYFRKLYSDCLSLKGVSELEKDRIFREKWKQFLNSKKYNFASELYTKENGVKKIKVSPIFNGRFTNEGLKGLKHQRN